MRRPMVVANWKMYTRASDAYILANMVRDKVAGIDGVEVVICPPIVWLSEIAEIVKRDGKVSAGAQNMYHEEEGPFTGEVSPLMIRDIAKYVIVGHSERRDHFSESNMLVNEKVLAALKHGLSPIICVGEKTKSAPISFVVKQLKDALAHVSKKEYQNIVIAYEPVWAVGTHQPSSVEHTEKTTVTLREIVGREVTMLYGGSVNHTEAEKFVKSQVDGLLVGGASLHASRFIDIVKIWAEGKSFK